MNAPMVIIVMIFALLLAFAVVVIFRYYREKDKNTRLENKYKELEMKVHGLELETIKYKLNPHLFKNTLNSIQSHAYQTYYSLDKLANVLDYILYESDKRFVTVREEIDFAMNLIEINRLKISPLFDLRVKNKIEENEPICDQKLVAPLISVDLIENAFKHADLQSPEAFISIVFEFKDNKFLLTVSNKISNKNAIKKEKGGFGKENFKKRLDIIYKENYTLDRFVETDVYIAHLKIDLLEHKAKMLAIG